MKVRLVGFASAALAISASLVGCGSSDTKVASGSSGGDGGSGGSAACVIAPRAAASLPQVSASGKSAKAVVTAIDAILAAQTPPTAPAKRTYSAKNLDASLLSAPVGTDGYGAPFDLEIDGQKRVKVNLDRPSQLAQNLFDALAGAGVAECNDPAHGQFIAAVDFRADVARSQIELENNSEYRLPPEPNVVVDANAAGPVLDAFRAAKITECEAASSLFFVCNTESSVPGCSVQKLDLDKVGDSELVYTCTPRSSETPRQLDAADSEKIWKALLGAAKAAGYQPDEGTLDNANVINASYFQFDGNKLGMTIVVTNATPPPPVPQAP
jgi:hypothetical protein